MAYNFLGLVNEICGRVNETQLTSSNFASAGEHYNIIKDSVNNAISYINSDEFTWPFNYVEAQESLVAGQLRYPYPTDAKFVDFNTFRIKRNATFGNETKLLREVDYEEYLSKAVDWEYDTSNTGIRDLPKYVCRAPGQEFIILPPADNTYDLVYEYYSVPIKLQLYSDVPTVPEPFSDIIVEGAMYYVYDFRSDATAERQLRLFDNRIKALRKIYANRFEYLRDTRVHRGGPQTYRNTLEV